MEKRENSPGTSANMPLDRRSRVIILLETHGLVCEVHGVRARRYRICACLGLCVKLRGTLPYRKPGRRLGDRFLPV
jgi:hypothetical protein